MTWGDYVITLDNKTVLITGATGLVGSNLTHKLIGMGNVNIIVLARSLEKIKVCFGRYIGLDRFDYLVQDVTEPIRSYKHIDYVFHAAGPMEGDIINNYPMNVINANLCGLQNCLELLYRQKINTCKDGRLVVFSSVTVYGEREDDNIFVSEDDTSVAYPIDVAYAAYSESKRMSEVYALAYAKQFGLDIVIGRLSSVYGYTNIRPNTAFYEFLNRAINGDVIELKNPNIKMRDNIYIDDAINGLLYVAVKGVRCEAYNISSNNEMGNYAGVDKMASIMVNFVKEKYKINSSLMLPQNSVHYRGVIMNNNKLKQLGWSLDTGLLEGLAKTLNKMHSGV